MIKWTYFLLNASFFLPVIIFAVVYYWKLIRQQKKYILTAVIFGFLIFFVVDPIATYWKAWKFDYSQTLNIRFGNSVLEELVFGILVSVIVAIATAVGARKDEQKQKIFD